MIDDVKQDLDTLAATVSDYYARRQLTVQLHTFSSPAAFWEDYTPDKYDLVFLDIYMEQSNGMNVALNLRQKGDSCALILSPAVTLSQSPATTSRLPIIF